MWSNGGISRGVFEIVNFIKQTISWLEEQQGFCCTCLTISCSESNILLKGG